MHMYTVLAVFSVLEGILLVWLMCNTFFLPKLPSEERKTTTSELVSILIPLRNEEAHVPDLIVNLKSITYPNIEILLLDDQSTDATKALLEEHIQGDSRFTIIPGVPLPDGWNGKVHACHRLSKQARGAHLFFIDADVRVSATIVEQTLAFMNNNKADMISGFPRYITKPLVQLLVTMQHFIIQLHLPLFLANKTGRTSTTAACGQFIAFKRSIYDYIGGHKAVYASLLEDVELARLVKKHSGRMILANISDNVECYMYPSLQSAWEGFTKNIFVGIGKSKAGALTLSLFYCLFYVMPFMLFLYSLGTDFYYAIPFLIIVLHKLVVDLRSRTNPLFSLGISLSAVMLMGVLWSSMYKAITGKAYTWKGRFYS
ncbi:glycosyltransferase [Pontibacillus salicampi]|uniref:4,4'-diaponeurosporenoate glycosyltransferase n=1 Tax=Pontibacillus salicampi TaxID=1449801 RepID=A0ABV6LIG6_9BACI